MAQDAFHPELRRAARWLPRSAVTARLLKPMRALSGLVARRAAGDVEVRPVGAVTVRVHRAGPSGGQKPGLLWIHGGGFVMGTAAQDDALCRRFAERIGGVVASVDYRLAPEQHYPVPLEDCYEGLRWLAAQPDVDPSRLAIGGASAGGGLAAGLALLARQRAEIAVAFQLLVYPMLDDRTTLRSDIDESNFRLWNNRANRFGWQSYTGLPPGSDRIASPAAPARAEDLSGLPPAWVGVGTLDLFHDEDVDYAHRLAEAGVKCDLEVVPGAFHGFDGVCARTAVAKAFRSAQADALAAALT